MCNYNDINFSEIDFSEIDKGNANIISSTLMQEMILIGGEKIGHHMNSDAKNRPNFIEVNGEKVVCLAKGGECRVYGEFYGAGGLNNSNSWKTPIISRNCPNQCSYKYLVCEGHGEHDKDVFSITYYPEYNKYRGIYEKYCKDFDRLEK